MEEENKQEETQKEKSINEKVIEQTEKLINIIVQDDLEVANVDLLYKLIDIHKDMKNEEYWKKGENEMYRDYGNDYGYRGNYNDNSYGRRGVKGTGRGRYRGEQTMDAMHEGYQDYQEGREAYNRGNYGAKEDTIKSLDYMLKATVDFIEMLQDEAQSQEEVELIKKYTRKISEM